MIESADKFTNLFELAPTGYFILSKEGDIVDANLSGRIMLGKEHMSMKRARFGIYISDLNTSIHNTYELLEDLLIWSKVYKCLLYKTKNTIGLEH